MVVRKEEYTYIRIAYTHKKPHSHTRTKHTETQDKKTLGELYKRKEE